MDPNTESTQPSVDERLILCSMPQEWSSLPVHPPHAAPSNTNTISVFTPGKRRSLRYIGYICPLMPTYVTLEHFYPPRPSRSRQLTWGMKHQLVLERIQAQDRLFQERHSPVLPPSDSRQAEPTPPPPPSLPPAQDAPVPPTPPAVLWPPAPQPDLTYPLAEEILEREISMVDLQCVNGMWYPADAPSPAPLEEQGENEDGLDLRLWK